MSGTTPGEPKEIRADATLEIWVETDERGDDVDLVVLQCAADLDSIHPGTGARVLTGDAGMRIRAQRWGLTGFGLPEEFRKADGSANAD